MPRDGEPAKLAETEVGGHPRRARGHAVIREQAPARLFQAQSEQVALWRRPMYRPERHASVPIAKFASVCGLQASVRFRSSPEPAARPGANFGIEGHWQSYDSSAASNPKFAIGLAARLCELRVRGASSGLRNRRTLATL